MSNARNFARIAQNVDSSGRSSNVNNPIFRVRPKTVSTNFSATYLNSSTYWNDPVLNDGNCWDSSTGKFTAPIDGNYFFSANLRFDAFTGSYFYFDIRKNQNASPREMRLLSSLGYTYHTFSLSGVIKMSTNDYVQIWCNSVGDTSMSIDGDSDFVGMLIS